MNETIFPITFNGVYKWIKVSVFIFKTARVQSRHIDFSAFKPAAPRKIKIKMEIKDNDNDFCSDSTKKESNGLSALNGI